MLRFLKMPSASQLTDQWDRIANTYFQRRKFLIHTDKYNPCQQRYYLAFQKDQIVAGACVYSLKLDIFTFSRLKYPLPFNIIGIPASISDPGLVGEEKHVRELLNYILQLEKGIILCLNIPVDFRYMPNLLMRTLPNVVLAHNFPDFDAYLSSLRSKYRRRINIIMKAFKDVRIERVQCSLMTRDMYGLYEQIMERTSTKLEKLPYENFTNLPEEFVLNTYTINSNVVCWNICLSENRKQVFFFGGMDYDYKDLYMSYFNSLLDITMNGINSGKKILEYGQTAEIPKIKCGGKLVEKNMFIYHANPLLRMMLMGTKRLLQYRHKPPVFHVFSTPGNAE